MTDERDDTLRPAPSPVASPDPSASSDASVGTDPTALDRRTFLRLSAAAGLVTACADDAALIGDGTGTETGDGDGDPSGDGDGDGDPTGDGDGDPSGDGDGDPTGDGDGDGDGDPSGDGDGDGDGDPICEPTVLDFDPEAVPVDDQQFPLALMAGEMRPTSVMLTVFIADAAPKRLRVWQPGEAAGQILLAAELDMIPDVDGYAKISVEGLCPGQWYRYAYFVVDDQGGEEQFSARSRIAEVRTAIASNSLEPLTVACSACNGSSLQWPALARTAEEYYDLFLHLGDMAYNDGAFTLEQYRDRWKQYLGAEGFKSVYGLAGLYATWDDHEITDNSQFDRETTDPQELQKKANALRSYFEVLPIDAEAPDYRLWRSFRWGLTAEFIVLDCRYERKPSIGEYMTQAQMDWLKQTLADSPCHFKVILNSVPITDMPLIWDVAAADRWEGFPNSRNELLGFIDAEQIDNVWFIAGDFHVCFVSRLQPSGSNLSARTREIAMTGGNTNILGNTLGFSGHFDFGSGSPHACLLTFDPALDSVNVRFIRTDGTVAYDKNLTQA
jgi:phosphodiesterase/alkaline phosphatase D-like protein